MADSTTTNDVLVIGGGLAGLTAAAEAARAGASVLLLEKAGGIGGRASTQNRDGFLLNQGAHALYRAGVGRGILRDLGVETKGGVPSPAGGFTLAGGIKHTFPGGLLSLLTTGLLPLAGKLDVARILATLPRLDTSTYDTMSVADAARNLSKHDEVGQLLQALFRLSTYGNAPEEQSAGSALAQLKLALDKNVIYVDGGWETMVTQLRRIAQSGGADVRTSARVDRIDVTPGGVEAHTPDGTHRARSVVLALGPSEAAALLAGDARATLSAWADACVPSYAACLDVCLEEVPAPRSSFALGVDQPIYLSVHSAVAKLAPEGRGLIQCMKYLGPAPSDDPRQAEHELEAALDLVQPGWRDATLHRRYLPQMIVVHGVPLASQGGEAGRPGPEVPGADNVFVAGDWVGPEGQLADASLASGRRAGALAAERRVAAAAA